MDDHEGLCSAPRAGVACEHDGRVAGHAGLVVAVGARPAGEAPELGLGGVGERLGRLVALGLAPRGHRHCLPRVAGGDGAAVGIDLPAAGHGETGEAADGLRRLRPLGDGGAGRLALGQLPPLEGLVEGVSPAVVVGSRAAGLEAVLLAVGDDQVDDHEGLCSAPGAGVACEHDGRASCDACLVVAVRARPPGQAAALGLGGVGEGLGRGEALGLAARGHRDRLGRVRGRDGAGLGLHPPVAGHGEAGEAAGGLRDLGRREQRVEEVLRRHLDAPVAERARREVGQLGGWDALGPHRLDVDEVEAAIGAPLPQVRLAVAARLPEGDLAARAVPRDVGGLHGLEAAARQLDHGEHVAVDLRDHRVETPGVTHAGEQDGEVDAGAGAVAQHVAPELHVLAEAVAEHPGGRLVLDAVMPHELVDRLHEAAGVPIGLRGAGAAGDAGGHPGVALHDGVGVGHVGGVDDGGELEGLVPGGPLLGLAERVHHLVEAEQGDAAGLGVLDHGAVRPPVGPLHVESGGRGGVELADLVGEDGEEGLADGLRGVDDVAALPLAPVAVAPDPEAHAQVADGRGAGVGEDGLGDPELVELRVGIGLVDAGHQVVAQREGQGQRHAVAAGAAGRGHLEDDPAAAAVVGDAARAGGEGHAGGAGERRAVVELAGERQGDGVGRRSGGGVLVAAQEGDVPGGTAVPRAAQDAPGGFHRAARRVVAGVEGRRVGRAIEHPRPAEQPPGVRYRAGELVVERVGDEHLAPDVEIAVRLHRAGPRHGHPLRRTRRGPGQSRARDGGREQSPQSALRPHCAHLPFTASRSALLSPCQYSVGPPRRQAHSGAPGS